MNRIILIGNGFDLAHGLKTGYRDFMCNYWKEFAQNMHRGGGVLTPHEDDFVKFEFGNSQSYSSLCIPDKELTSSSNIQAFIRKCDYDALRLSFKNGFWKHISDKASLETWLDIENEYYSQLKSHLNSSNRSEQVKKLNEEFCAVREMLEEYLTGVCNGCLPNVEPNKQIIEALYLRNGIERRCVDVSKQSIFSECVPERKETLRRWVKEDFQEKRELLCDAQAQKVARRILNSQDSMRKKTDEELDSEIEQNIERMGLDPDNALVINFNYTPTFEKLYGNYGRHKTINIHGELNSSTNPIIFGYGDEMDVDYQEIERTNDNDMLNNMKHIHYMNTANYRQFLEFLQLDSYQVFIMGHSCGNSDRTLLNTLFEHPNCASIMPFYYQWADDEVKKAGDDYMEIYKNISRNFTDKQKMRNIVVNKTYCKPHPQNTPSELVD